MIKNKKASHVGIILSFVIFVTFVVFLFSIFGSPIKFLQGKESTLDYLEVELENSLLSNLTTLTISLDVTENCIKIDNRAFGVAGIPSIVKNKDGGIKPSINSGNDLIFKREGDDFFKIYYAQELFSINSDEQMRNCYELDLQNDVSSFRLNFFYTENKINSFISDYESDYTKLKDDLGLASDTEFSFSFTNAEGEIFQTEQKETSANIYAREIPVQYFNDLAEIKSGFINLKVW